MFQRKALSVVLILIVAGTGVACLPSGGESAGDIQATIDAAVAGTVAALQAQTPAAAPPVTVEAPTAQPTAAEAEPTIPPPQPTAGESATGGVSGPERPEYIERVLASVNEARAAEGLPPYTLNPLLTQAAQAQSEYQRNSGQITHRGPDGSRPIDRVLAVGYPARRAIENIYYGGTPEEAVEWWLTADEDHRAVVLDILASEAGIGAATDASGLTYFTLVVASQ
ncbi:MAG TPA: hypothetical protein ENI95_13280 [Chloroflexi bacterium]|nr:hypothetical protein [Chloroflexota bacterium]